MENEFADIVKRMILIRQLLGMTQKELADRIGYSLSHVKKDRIRRQDAHNRLFHSFLSVYRCFCGLLIVGLNKGK